jgi:restriction system protein
VCSSDLPARRFAEGKHLKLIDGLALLDQIKGLPADEQQSLLEEITRGDYTTPSCPQCVSRLVIKPNRPGWWSCPQFPKCNFKGIRVRKSSKQA